MDIEVARALRGALEPYHIPVYFDPEPAEEYEQLGLRGPRMGYFASRSAALGGVSAEVVTATFYGFHPGIVARSIPEAWTIASPQQVLEARLRGIDRALRRRFAGEAGSDVVCTAATLAREFVGHCRAQGRPLFAAHEALAWPEEPHLALWHAATLYREYRGDGHITVLLSNEIGPCESLVLDAADGRNPADFLKKVRAWSDDEWTEAQDALARRGLLTDDGSITDAGRSLREHIELETDRLSAGPAVRLGDLRTERLLDAMSAVDGAIAT